MFDDDDGGGDDDDETPCGLVYSVDSNDVCRRG